MYKVTKQSLIDWQVTKNGKAHAWINKGKDGLYCLTFKELGKVAEYKFIFYKEAVNFSKTAL